MHNDSIDIARALHVLPEWQQQAFFKGVKLSLVRTLVVIKNEKRDRAFAMSRLKNALRQIAERKEILDVTPSWGSW